MEPSCVRQTLIPGTSKLYSDYLYHFDRVSRFYRYDFHNPDALQDCTRALDYPDARRSALVSALRAQNANSEALSTLARPETVAVVTGQQVGFGSGPAYTVFKALTAVRLANELKQSGIAAVPIFWLATEDHDLAEVDHAWVFNHELIPSRVGVAGTVVSGGGPVGEVQFNEIPVDMLRGGLGQLPFADEVVSRFQSAYRAGKTFGAAFRSFLQDLFKDFGLLFLDPLAANIRQIAAPFLADAARRVPELLPEIKQRNSDLVDAGYHAQVHIDGNASLFFVLKEGKRLAVRWNNGRFVTREGSYEPADFAGIADHLSPNALLRPVMQDFLLPTIAYVGGPAEIAYMAQGQVLYESLLGRMPVIYPRNSFTLLDARATKLLGRYRLSIPDLLDHEDQVKARIAERLVPSDLQDELSRLRDSVSSSVERTRSALGRFDKTLEAAAAKSTAKILYQVDKLAQRTSREMLRRDERAAKDASYLMNLVYPHRVLQERFYSILPFLAKYGWDLPHDLLSLTQLTCPDHMVRTI